MKIFGDAIDDKIFPKKVKRFTQEEKNLIENFINSILREDKESEIEHSTVESFDDRRDCITEQICKIFIFKGINFQLTFNKFYTNEKKTIDWLPSDQYSLSDLLYDGYSTHSSGVKDTLLKALDDDKSITGIFVQSYRDYFALESLYKGRKKTEVDALGIRTKYQDADRGGFHLTTKCKNHIKKVHFKIIKNTILKAVKDNR
jgi:hypothetical protein